MAATALQRRAKEAHSWLMDACFPLWSEVGVGKKFFLERLDLSHKPIDSPLTRVRVQARQAYLFALAAKMGWNPERARSLTEVGLSALSGPSLRADGLPGRTLNVETGSLENDTADLYDAAFSLYAFAEVSKISEIPNEIHALSHKLLAAVDTHLRDRANGGYTEALPPLEHRLQNPHMHLFEACLALSTADPEARHLARAGEIFDLFGQKFTQPDGLLGERFATDWSTLTGDAHDVIEPGHQFEWVWLLHTYAKQTRTEPSEAMLKLYEFGCKTLDSEGRAIQEVHRETGAPVDASRRTWPQTEALKAHLAMAERGDGDAAARAMISFDILMDEYLTPEGGWIDHFDADGHVIAKDMPASTGYHVALALDELIRLYGA